MLQKFASASRTKDEGALVLSFHDYYPFFPDDLWRRIVRLPIVGHRAYDRFGMRILGYLSAYRSA